jgi:uncharacterized RDD family membrane protein YckC
MIYDVQKASMWKRISAWLLDIILLAVLAVGLGALISYVTGYDSYNQQLLASYDKYETQYGVEFEVTQEQWEAMTQEQQDRYNEAYEALVADQEAMYAYNMVINLMLVSVSVSVLFAYLVLEFAVPLLLKNGQTLGKKVFSLALMRSDGVRITPFMLFVRTVLGKYTIETMIPVLVALMIFFGTIGLIGPTIVLILLVIQLILLAVSRNNTAIHDFIAHTVVVDLSSQLIFDTPEDLVAYKQKIAAEKAAKQNY